MYKRETRKLGVQEGGNGFKTMEGGKELNEMNHTQEVSSVAVHSKRLKGTLSNLLDKKGQTG